MHRRLSLDHVNVAYMCGGDILVWQYKMVMTSLYILICEIMFACVHMLKQFVLSPIPCFAMASSFMARFGSAWFCQQNPLAWFCPGSAPVRCHPDTGTPQWGSAEVYFFLIVLLVCFLFSLLVSSVLLALSALPCLPIVCAKPEIKKKSGTRLSRIFKFMF